jgi:mono/diheme cytochrome c family protein
MKKTLKTVLAVGVVVSLLALGGVAAVYSGAYDIGADTPHTRPVYAVLETARQRSIAVRADDLQVPADLNNAARIRQGAGNYNAMCTGCHLTPGAEETELSKGLYPKPPNLSLAQVRPAEAFWVIKHGIKASGMPAWGASMGDEYIWNIAAFLQALPKLDKAGYDTLVASSGGHSHGGGETGGHSHADEGEAHHHDEGEAHDEMAGMPMDESKPHSHPPGTPPHDDAPKNTKPAAADPHAGMDMPETEPASDGHDHQH